MFAGVGQQVMDNTAAGFPYQSIIDNCDLMHEHLTVEVIEKETIDTSDLSTERMSKEAALNLFDIDQLLLNSEINTEEKMHLKYVVGVAVGKILTEHRPMARKFKEFLPHHHKHPLSSLVKRPAMTFIMKPYPYQAGTIFFQLSTVLQQKSIARNRFLDSSD